MSRLEKEDGVRCPVCDSDLTKPASIVETVIHTMRSHIDRDEYGNMEYIIGEDPSDREGSDGMESSQTLHTCRECGNLIELG